MGSACRISVRAADCELNPRRNLEIEGVPRQMVFEDLIILIPSHSLEDFPTDLPEESAAGLLNAFCVTWHPRLLADAEVIPRWHRADDPPELVERRLVILPQCSQDWIPHGWSEQSQEAGCVVLENLTQRDEMLSAALAPLTVEGEPDREINSDIVADFLALGFCYLQTELLSRHMRHYSNLDEVHIQREAVAAAQAAMAGDDETARSHLRSCFEVLADARDRFYPVDSYLVDVCLLIPRLADEHLSAVLKTLNPVNFLATAEDLQQIAESDAAMAAALREAWERGTVDILGGEYQESCTQLLPLESVLWQFERGLETFEKLFQRRPKVWGRHRFGLSPQIPQILDKQGYDAAMHVALDDGIYPDEEQSKIRWEGCDGSVVDAITRIPLAADSATSYLRFPERMAESMDQDHVATVVLARWPEIESPWLEDLRRIQAYAPVLGRFVTLSDYFQQTDSPGRLSAFRSHEYLTPFFIQAVARQEADPISRYARHLRRRQTLQSARWFEAVNQVLRGQSVQQPLLADMEYSIESTGPDAVDTDQTELDKSLDECLKSSTRRLADLITHSGPPQDGYLICNSLGFARTVAVELPELSHPPAAGDQIKRVQWDDRRRAATVEVPGMGFAWVTAGSPREEMRSKSKEQVPLAEELLLRNEMFELTLNEQTGGIGRLKGHGRKPNRISQQITYRYSQDRTLPAEDEQSFGEATPYAEMCLRSTEVLCDGPSLGEIRATGEIVDQVDGQVLAGFEQTLRIWRGSPKIEIDLTLDVQRQPDGNPWLNYYTMRFAWNNAGASLTRSMMGGAQDIKDERFENLHYFEIADDEERTTILNHGLPFQRTTGMRMIDFILVAAGETQRNFRFDIVLDHSYPLQAALDAMTPAAVLPCPAAPSNGATSGWFFNIDAKNVQVVDILPLRDAPVDPVDDWDHPEPPAPVEGDGLAVRLVETEGRASQVRLRSFKNPRYARQRDFQGRTITDLTIEGDAVFIDMTAYEIADVELRF